MPTMSIKVIQVKNKKKRPKLPHTVEISPRYPTLSMQKTVGVAGKLCLIKLFPQNAGY